MVQTAFHNITRIMDCVGCEKCKMWGKLQLLGIATSLKILFSAEDCGGHPHDQGQQGQFVFVSSYFCEQAQRLNHLTLLCKARRAVRIICKAGMHTGLEEGGCFSHNVRGRVNN